MQLPDAVGFVEVGPRDGFQSIPDPVPTEAKVRVIDMLAEAGVPRIEVTSFVHPTAVPQLADAEQVIRGISAEARAGARYLIPNVRGMQRAIDAGARNVLVIVSASERFNKANINRSVQGTLDEIAQVMRLALEHGVKVDASVSTAWVCPFEGSVSPERVLGVARRLHDLGIREMSIADTIGAANPRQVRELFADLRRALPDVTFDAHFHDTRGMGLANALAALEAGVTLFEGSVAGIGGCPFAPGATGNVCSEDLLHMLEEMGVRTGVDLDRLIETARYVEKVLGHDLPGRIKKAGRARKTPKLDE